MFFSFLHLFASFHFVPLFRPSTYWQDHTVMDPWIFYAIALFPCLLSLSHLEWPSMTYVTIYCLMQTWMNQLRITKRSRRTGCVTKTVFKSFGETSQAVNRCRIPAESGSAIPYTPSAVPTCTLGCVVTYFLIWANIARWPTKVAKNIVSINVGFCCSSVNWMLVLILDKKFVHN